MLPICVNLIKIDTILFKYNSNIMTVFSPLKNTIYSEAIKWYLSTTAPLISC